MKTYLSILALTALALPAQALAQAPASALLTGKTPANFTVPSGWTLVRTQDFESGKVASDEMGFGSITTNTPHSGTRSMESRVWKDDCATGWKLSQGVATTGELYLSWYEFMEGQGRLNDEMFLLSIRKNWPGGRNQTERWQWLNYTGIWEKCFNLLEGRLVFFCEGDQPGTPTSICYNPENIWRSVGFGKWQQWEVYWKTNTPGQADGFTRIYLDGVKITEIPSSGFSGFLNMDGPGISLGGPTYTKIIWGPYKKPSTVVATNAKEINYSIDRPKDFALPVLGGAIQAPPDGYVPIFNRFIDDIIILQRGTPTTTEAVAPTTPTDLAGFALSPTAVSLTWTGSTDNTEVVGYHVYRKFSDRAPARVGTTADLSFVDTDPKLVAGETYIYTVCAYDPSSNASPDSAAITVTLPAETITSFAAWRAANFSGADLTDDTISGPSAAPDGSGFSNLVRYAFELPARGRVASPVRLTTAENSGLLALTCPRRGKDWSLSYDIQSSTDLVTWTNRKTDTSGYPRSITFTDPDKPATTMRRFYRVRITQK